MTTAYDNNAIADDTPAAALMRTFALGVRLHHEDGSTHQLPSDIANILLDRFGIFAQVRNLHRDKPAAVFYAGHDAWYHGREPLAVMPCY